VLQSDPKVSLVMYSIFIAVLFIEMKLKYVPGVGHRGRDIAYRCNILLRKYTYWL
jgi:hypothetical protein